MKQLIIECENAYNSWNLENDFVVENAKKIYNYYLSCEDISQNCCLKNYEYERVSFDFLLCDNAQTHVINRDYRNKDYPADIITFAIFADSGENERFVQDMEINLGEVIISLDKMIENSKEKDIDPKTELLFFISHGILHLLGFDHQSEEEFDFVISHQKKALESLNINYDKI